VTEDPIAAPGMRTLAAGDLLLQPQTAAHAADMFTLLSDPALYLYLDDEPLAMAASIG
jgi:hypothetical protein